MKPVQALSILSAIAAVQANREKVDLDALRKRCREVDLIELGQILMDSRTNAEQQVVAAEINKRLRERRKS